MLHSERVTFIDGLLPQAIYKSQDVVQVNIPAESGEMGVLANHVPSIEQLKPGLIEVIEESGGSKQFFCTFTKNVLNEGVAADYGSSEQCLEVLLLSSPTPFSASTPWKASLLKISARKQYGHRYQKHKRSPVVVEASRILLRLRSNWR